jgi:hypothetical protein
MRLHWGLEGFKEWRKGESARRQLQQIMRKRFLLAWLHMMRRGRRNKRLVQAACRARQLLLVWHCWSCWRVLVGRGAQGRLGEVSRQLQVG